VISIFSRNSWRVKEDTTFGGNSGQITVVGNDLLV